MTFHLTLALLAVVMVGGVVFAGLAILLLAKLGQPGGDDPVADGDMTIGEAD